MWFLIYFVVIIYAMLTLSAALLFFLKGKKRLSKFSDVGEGYNLLIAVRNEESKIESLFKTIKQLEGLKKVVIVNDHSEDATVSLIESHLGAHSHVTLLNLNKTEQGKKYAIKLGLSQFTFHEKVLIFDADNSINEHYADTVTSFQKNINLRLMPVWPKAEHPTWFVKLAQMETAGTWGINAILAHFLFPISANGANMMLHQGDWIEAVDWKFNTASGDDLAILKAAIQNSKKIEVEIDVQYLVDSDEALNFTDFVARRVRWVSKPFSLFSSLAIIVGALVLISNLSMYYFLILVLMGNWLSLNLILLKLFCDLMITYMVFKRWNKPFNLLSFTVLWWVYPAVLIWIGFRKITSNQSWKGRKLKSV